MEFRKFFLVFIMISGMILTILSLTVENPGAIPSVSRTISDNSENPSSETATPQALSASFLAVSQEHPGNNELQTYKIQQTELRNNLIILTAISSGNGYESGKAESKMAILYGDFSFRISILKGTGLFPAIWMLPADGEKFPELDIYEAIGSNPHLVYGVLHSGIEFGFRKESFCQAFSREDLPESFVWSFQWSEDGLRWFLNGKPVYTQKERIPREPMYLIINLAVGGNWPGMPDDPTVFPAEFQVELLKFEPQNLYAR